MTDIQSMTGFASAARAIGPAIVTCDLRSVNGRSLDIKLRLPTGLESLEAPMRKRISGRLARGNTQMSLAIDRTDAQTGTRIDGDAFRRLADEAVMLARAANLPPPTADGILMARGVLIADESAAQLGPDDADEIFALIDEALDGLVGMRRTEGGALAAAVARHLGTIETLVSEAMADPASQPAAVRERLAAQIGRLLDDRSDAALDPVRLNAEAALLATKADIREETDRLLAHVAAARALLAEGGAVGRKLDFLSQELNREANTLCAKSASTGLTAIGLDLKSAIDQLREQVQNIQ